MIFSAHYLSTLQVTICQQCGYKGSSNAFLYCVQCLNVAVHCDCLDEIPGTLDEFMRWVCEDCLGVSSLSDQFQEVSSEIDSTLESKLGGDNSSPIKVNAKRKYNATNLVAVTDCSSRDSLDSHATIDSNEQSESTSNFPSSQNLPEDTSSIGDREFDEQFPKHRFSADSKPALVGGSRKKESELSEATQLRDQTSIVGYNSSLSNKGNEPVSDIIWRGSFNFWNANYSIVDGLVAHLSVKACEKVYKQACVMPSLLHLEMHRKSDVWPDTFSPSGPTDDHIALYFFPADSRCEKRIDDLVNLMIREDLAMRVFLSNAELLVFTSNELPLRYWKFQGKPFIWGVFRGKAK
ncbi:PREDICTED: uncharacterized protein LOC109184758 isoform X2 [Ipomoea nil]|uniref:uncharacterized protein LOC109184758 isoform X2 n=1 Tax=Ipomoea nil TaxID=35883 RepID=UPI000901E8CB|nr:PREDICTED: uncharacterized protein LOC109184758 isoform X2 [Ipomoea nil]